MDEETRDVLNSNLVQDSLNDDLGDDVDDDNDDGQDEGGKPTGFKIPEAYANEEWAKRIKDEDALWKEHANAQKLIGKKEIVFDVPDFKTMSEDKIKEYFNKLTPETPDEYEIQLQDENNTKYFKELFKEAGISKYSANKVLEGYAKYEQEQLKKLTSKKEYDEKMSAIFGQEYSKGKSVIDEILLNSLTQEEIEIINTKMPNDIVATMYKAAKIVADKYGYKEGSLAVEGNNSLVASTAEEKSTLHKQYYDELQAISKRPHTAEEKQAIVDKIGKLYK